MKIHFSNIMVTLMAIFVSVSMLAVTQASAAMQPSPEMDAWLKASKLGPYNKNENWSDIVARAK